MKCSHEDARKLTLGPISLTIQGVLWCHHCGATKFITADNSTKWRLPTLARDQHREDKPVFVTTRRLPK